MTFQIMLHYSYLNGFTKPYYLGRTGYHVSSQMLWQPAQSAQVKPETIPTPKRGRELKVLCLTKKPMVIYTG